MNSDDNIVFCKDRENAERAAAAAASDSIARGIHNELANRYAERHRSLSMSAVGGEAAISNASGEVALLTPNEALEAADLLMATGRAAAHQKSK